MKRPSDVNPASRQRQPRRQDAPPQVLRQLEESQKAARQEKAAARKSRQTENATAQPGKRLDKLSGTAGRDERRRQGGLKGKQELGMAVDLGSGPAPFPETALLRKFESPRLEQRISAWLDVLVYAWRRRTQGAKARFLRNVHLTETEINQLGAAVQILSRGFTGHRRLVGKTYLSDPDLLGAYLLFYWPVSYAQAWTVLDEQRRRFGNFSLSQVADIGSGPGPLTCALIDMSLSAGESSCQALAIDHSPLALELLREICRLAYGPDFESQGYLRTETMDISQPPTTDILPGVGFDCVSFGHSLNELWPEQSPQSQAKHRQKIVESWMLKLRAQAEKAEPENGQSSVPPLALILEPALKTTTRSLLQLRDNLANGGKHILGPCFFQDNCPALAQPEGTCHSQVFWEQPTLIRRLATTAKLSKDELAMAWLALSNGPKMVDTGAHFRVVSEAMVNKAGRTRIMLCGKEGRLSFSALLSAAASQTQPSQKAKAAQQAFAALRRGDAITIQNPEIRDTGLGLSEDTIIEIG